MNDFIKKSVLLGVGAYSKAQKELEKAMKSLIKNNKITREEGEHVLNKFLTESKKTLGKLEGQVKKDVGSFAKRVTLAKQKDLSALALRVKKMEAQLKTKFKKGK